MSISQKFARGAVLALLVAMAPLALAELEDLQAKGVAVIVMSGEYPPFSMPDEAGNLIGFDADVAKELAERLGVEARLQQAEFSSIVGGIQAGVFDISVASHAHTEERARAVTFSAEPYYYGGGMIFVREDTDYESLADLEEARAAIAVDLGGTNQQYLEEAGYPNIATYSGVQDSLLAISSGRADAIFTTPVVGYNAIEKGQPIRALEEMIFEENAFVLIARGQPELEAAINEALNEMRADGTLEEIGMRWIGGDITSKPD
jgi:ABC-type amino acid transport substrate-binding protein